jgi:DnaJ domain
VSEEELVAKSAGLYDVLGVAPSVTADELKTAYRELARQHHPDRARTYMQKIAATRRMQAINAAYAVLRDPERRAAYDAEQLGLFEKWVRRTTEGDGSAPAGPGARRSTSPTSRDQDVPPAMARGMALAGAVTVLFAGGRLSWAVAVLFLVAQLAYCYRTDCLDDWAWGIGLDLLAFWWLLTRTPGRPRLAFMLPYGFDWQAALGVASGVSAIFIGVRQLKRRGRPLLDDDDRSVFRRL